MRLGVEAAIVRGELVPGDVELLEGHVEGVGLAGAGSGIAAPGTRADVVVLDDDVRVTRVVRNRRAVG